MGPKTKPEKRRHLRDASAIHGVAKQAAAGGGFGAPIPPPMLISENTNRARLYRPAFSRFSSVLMGSSVRRFLNAPP